MSTNKAYITFSIAGLTYEYDGGLPDEVMAAAGKAGLLDDNGFWIDGYPPEIEAAGKDYDELPIARWEIEHVGGKVLEVHGARANGAIHPEDWKSPRIY